LRTAGNGADDNQFLQSTVNPPVKRYFDRG